DAEEPQAPIEQIRAAFAVIPNDDLGWEDWNNRGMALFRATAGSDDGLAIFHAWSSKSKKKYNAQRTDDKWAAYQSCPPTEIGVGSIFYWANEASPGWDDEQADDQLGEDDEARRRLLWEFIRTALRDGIDENQIIHACLDEKYRGRATYEHVRDHGGEDYIKRQVKRALNYDPLIVRRKRSLSRVEGGKLHELWRAVQRELIDRHCPVYVRGNRLVQPLWRWEKALDGREFLTAQFERYNVPRLADMVAHYAVKFQKFDGRMKRWKDSDPPDNLIEHILEARQWNFRTVVGIINAPTMRADGSLLTTEGYDPATQLWFKSSGDVTLPPIPDKPSKEDARRALALLKELLEEFPFDNVVARAAALAGIMTPVLRGALAGAVPAFALIATQARSGKTYLVELIGVIARGHIPLPIAIGSEKAEEMEKRIETAGLSGRPILHLNNLPNGMVVESVALAQLSTEGI